MRTNSNLYSPQWVSTDQLPKDLYSEILPNLYMGGTNDDDVIFNSSNDLLKITKRHFDSVVTMYSWAHPVDWEVQEMRYGIPDSHIRDINLNKLIEIANWGYRQWLLGDKLLVRCQAGLNRSGLVTALILMLHGLSATEAIEQIRKNRTDLALFNKNYVNWLIESGQEFVQQYLNQSNTSSMTR